MSGMDLVNISTVPTICKGEWCMSCLNKAQTQNTEQGVIVICSLELRKAGVNELEAQTVKCASWQIDPDADTITDEDVEVEDDEEGMKEPETFDTPESLRQYVFVGDSLVQDLRQSEESLELTTSFVERYNVLVQMVKSSASRKIEEIEGDVEEKLSTAKDKVKKHGLLADVEHLFVDGVIDYLKDIDLQDVNDIDEPVQQQPEEEEDDQEDGDFYDDEDEEDFYDDDDDESDTDDNDI